MRYRQGLLPQLPAEAGGTFAVPGTSTVPSVKPLTLTAPTPGCMPIGAVGGLLRPVVIPAIPVPI